MKNKIILSICIPTYNRGDVLDKTLGKLINDPAFDDRVEIVISDNCSTDNTELIVSKYIQTNHNIVYNRLPLNIGADLNMNQVLTMGSGLYIKLLNDTAILKEGVLRYMLETIQSCKDDAKPIFFYNNILFNNRNTIKECLDINSLIVNTSFLITWILNFGTWRTYFDHLEDKDRLVYLRFPQTDWTIRLVDKYKSATIHFGDFYEVTDVPKGGFDLLKTISVDYLSIYKEYLISKKITKRIYNVEKYRLFRYFLMDLYLNMILLKTSKFNFENINERYAFSLMIKNYRFNVYFYLGIIYLYIRYFIVKFIKFYQ